VGAAEQFEAIDHVLLLIGEAEQRAREASQELAKSGGEPHRGAALEAASRELLALHRRLWERIAAPSPAVGHVAVDADELTQSRDEPVSEPSAAPPKLGEVNEQHMAEVERVLFELSGARKRAEKVARTLANDGAEQHLVEALERAECELDATIDAFFKSTYFHVPKDQLALS